MVAHCTRCQRYTYDTHFRSLHTHIDVQFSKVTFFSNCKVPTHIDTYIHRSPSGQNVFDCLFFQTHTHTHSHKCSRCIPVRRRGRQRARRISRKKVPSYSHRLLHYRFLVFLVVADVAAAATHPFSNQVVSRDRESKSNSSVSTSSRLGIPGYLLTIL